MSTINIAQFVLFGLCLISGLFLLGLVIRKNIMVDNYDDIISRLEKNKKDNLEIINTKNREIDKLEKKILKCKKELGIKLFTR